MSQFLTLMWTRSRIGRHQIASIRHESRLKVGVVAVAAVLLWFGLLFAFWEGFLALRRLIPEAAGDVTVAAS